MHDNKSVLQYFATAFGEMFPCQKFCAIRNPLGYLTSATSLRVVAVSYSVWKNVIG